MNDYSFIIILKQKGFQKARQQIAIHPNSLKEVFHAQDN
jgi:hypothetical protein